jgi:hypothetical protein
MERFQYLTLNSRISLNLTLNSHAFRNLTSETRILSIWMFLPSFPQFPYFHLPFFSSSLGTGRFCPSLSNPSHSNPSGHLFSVTLGWALCSAAIHCCLRSLRTYSQRQCSQRQWEFHHHHPCNLMEELWSLEGNDSEKRLKLLNHQTVPLPPP